jgi:hypothetical protein
MWAPAFLSVLSYIFRGNYRITTGRQLREQYSMAYVSWSSALSSRLISAETIYPSGPTGSKPSSMVCISLPSPLGTIYTDCIVSADDLPLNVSRETLQNASFLRQLKQTILKRLIQTFTKISEEDPEKFAEIQKVYGNVFKLGVVEDSKNSDKLAPLIRFASNQRANTSLNEVCSLRMYCVDD